MLLEQFNRHDLKSFSLVASSPTGGPQPACRASSQRGGAEAPAVARTQAQKLYSSRGVTRSLPAFTMNSRKSLVISRAPSERSSPTAANRPSLREFLSPVDHPPNGGESIQAHGDRDHFQAAPDEIPFEKNHSVRRLPGHGAPTPKVFSADSRNFFVETRSALTGTQFHPQKCVTPSWGLISGL